VWTGCAGGDNPIRPEGGRKFKVAVDKSSDLLAVETEEEERRGADLV